MFPTAVATAVSALLLTQRAQAQTFSTFDISGVFEGDPFDVGDGPRPPPPDGTTIALPVPTSKGDLVRLCGCTNETEPKVDDIRSISDTWASSGTRVSSHGFSNLLWAWGQFIDHDVVATVDLDGPNTYTISLKNGNQQADMKLHRLAPESTPGQCPSPFTVNSPIIDAGVVYGDEPDFTQLTLRAPGTCFLRVSEGDMLPVTSEKVKGKYLFVAGDARVGEHSMLTSMHTCFMREHNRLCRVMMTDTSFSGMSVDDMFTRARNVVSAKMQQITLREFLPMLGITEDAVRTATPMTNSAAISIEFAMSGYRFGHDLVPDKMGSLNTVNLFNGEKFFGIDETGVVPGDANNKLASVFRNAAFSLANEIDGKISDTLRNFLFGDVLEDLCSRNIFRGRDMAVPQYSDIAACYGTTPVSGMMDETPDSFMALLRENKTPSSTVLGPTLKAMLTEQFHRIFFAGDGDFWENRKPSVASFESEILETTLSRVIRTNVPAAPIPGNAFNMRDRGTDAFTFPNPNATSFNEDCDPTISEFGCDDSTGNPDLQEGVRGDYDDTPGPASAGVDTDGAPTEADADPFADDELFQSIGGGNNGRGFTA